MFNGPQSRPQGGVGGLIAARCCIGYQFNADTHLGLSCRKGVHIRNEMQDDFSFDSMVEAPEELKNNLPHHRA